MHHSRASEHNSRSTGHVIHLHILQNPKFEKCSQTQPLDHILRQKIPVLNFLPSFFTFPLYSSPYIIRVIKSRRLRWAGHVARMGETRVPDRALVGKPEGRRPRRRWEDNINMIFERLDGRQGLDQSGPG